MGKLSVIIPTYDASSTLEPLCERLTAALSELPVEYEIIFVDDGSTDDTWETLRRFRRHDKRIRLLRHARNLGQHKALLTGLSRATGEFIVTMDDDLQHPPEEVPRLYNALLAHPEWEVVFGVYGARRHAWWRRLGSALVNMATVRIFGVPIGLQLTSFRVLRRHLANALVAMNSQSPRLNHMIAALTVRLGTVQVAHCPAPRSRYALSRLVSNALDTVLWHTAFPLQVVSALGLVLSAVSGFLGLYYLFRYFVAGTAVAGWTSIMVLMLLLFGVVLFSLGIIGEYLIRIIRQVQPVRPHIIEEDGYGEPEESR